MSTIRFSSGSASTACMRRADSSARSAWARGRAGRRGGGRPVGQGAEGNLAVLPGFEPVAAGVDGDAGQPGPEAGGISQRGQLLEAAHERFLGQFLGKVGAAEPGVAHRGDPPRPAQEQGRRRPRCRRRAPVVPVQRRPSPVLPVDPESPRAFPHIRVERGRQINSIFPPVRFRGNIVAPSLWMLPELSRGVPCNPRSGETASLPDQSRNRCRTSGVGIRQASSVPNQR